MRVDFPLFVTAINDPPAEAVTEIVQMFGKIPSSSWNPGEFNEDGYLERDGCGNAVVVSAELIIDPLRLILLRMNGSVYSVLVSTSAPREAWTKILMIAKIRPQAFFQLDVSPPKCWPRRR